MGFVVSGSLLYFEGPSPSPEIREEVCEGEWFCDQVLWLRWIHRGQMTGFQPCELVNLDSNIFRQIVGQRTSTKVRAMCGRFAECYLTAIADDMPKGRCNDLGFSVKKLDDIVSMVYEHHWTR